MAVRLETHEKGILAFPAAEHFDVYAMLPWVQLKPLEGAFLAVEISLVVLGSFDFHIHLLEIQVVDKEGEHPYALAFTGRECTRRDF